MLQQSLSPLSKQGRQRLVTLALNLTVDTPLAPKAYERLLLEEFTQGKLTIDQVVERLEQQQPA